MVPIHPVGLEKQAADVFFLNDAADEGQSFFGKFKAAARIDDFQDTEFSRDMGEHFFVELQHGCFIPGIVIDVVTESALAPGTGKCLKKDDFSLIFVRNAIVAFHNKMPSFLSECGAGAAPGADLCLISAEACPKSSRNRPV